MCLQFNFETPEYQINNVDSIIVWLEKVVRVEKRVLGEINFFLVGDSTIEKINSKYLQHYYPTDIITFDNSFLEKLSGDIYISIDTVKENASVHASGIFEDELNRNLVHGVLHLIGYNDKTDKEREIMRERENYHLSYLEEL